MAIRLYYNENTFKMYDITYQERKLHKYIEIKEEDKKIIINNLNAGNDCFVDEKNKEYYFLSRFNETEERVEIVSWRNSELEVVSYYRDNKWWHEVLTEKGVVVDDNYFADLKDYYRQLLDLPQAFDTCENKRNFNFIFVDELSEVQDDETYELLKPSFME
jgi:hypothetical protein